MLFRPLLAGRIARRALVNAQALPLTGRAPFTSAPRLLAAATARPNTTDHEREDPRSAEKKPTTVQGEEQESDGVPRRRPKVLYTDRRVRKDGQRQLRRTRRYTLQPGAPPTTISLDEWAYSRVQWLHRQLTSSSRSLSEVADWARRELASTEEQDKSMVKRNGNTRRTALRRSKWLLHLLEKEGVNFQAVYEEKVRWLEEETARRREAAKSAPAAEAGGSAAESNVAEVGPISGESTPNPEALKAEATVDAVVETAESPAFEQTEGDRPLADKAETSDDHRGMGSTTASEAILVKDPQLSSGVTEALTTDEAEENSTASEEGTTKVHSTSPGMIETPVKDESGGSPIASEEVRSKKEQLATNADVAAGEDQPEKIETTAAEIKTS